jgi:thiamine pyrophosphokinase
MSRRVVLFCGPVDYVVSDLYLPQEHDTLIGVDAGLGALIKAGLKADIAVGDFDSLPEADVEELDRHAQTILRLDVKKDKTDLAYALAWVYDNMDYDSILVFGGIGGRIDHFLANVNLLKKYDMTLMDKRHRIILLKKGTHRVDNPYDYVSFFALEDVYDLTIKGFDYELDHYYLATTDSLCVSNRGSGEVAFSKGRLLVVFSNDR